MSVEYQSETDQGTWYEVPKRRDYGPIWYWDEKGNKKANKKFPLTTENELRRTVIFDEGMNAIENQNRKQNAHRRVLIVYSTADDQNVTAMWVKKADFADESFVVYGCGTNKPIGRLNKKDVFQNGEYQHTLTYPTASR